MKSVQVGVCVVVHCKETMRILMIKRKGSHGEGTWSFPGGHVEFGEMAQAAAIRELEEETGITEDKIKKISRGPYIETVFNNENKHYITLYFLAQVDSENIAKICEPEKCSDMQWFNEYHLPEPLFKPVNEFVQKFGTQCLIQF